MHYRCAKSSLVMTGKAVTLAYLLSADSTISVSRHDQMDANPVISV